MLFIDGLGIGSEDPVINPMAGSRYSHLRTFLRRATPIDTTLGVQGLPQSATGQATLLTGANAAQFMRRHVEGFPGAALRTLVRKRNLLSELVARGYLATFANAYYLEDPGAHARMRRPSVTTVAALSAFGEVRQTGDLLRDEAVYQDLTRASLQSRGYTGRLVTPEESAAHLLNLARRMDFTLFEYFQTDRVAHRGSEQEKARVLDALNRFLGGLLVFSKERGNLLLLCSDHGNLEDARTTTHTLNPVPFAALGTGSCGLKTRVCSLLDVTPALLKLYPARGPGPRKSPARERDQKAPKRTVVKVVTGELSRKSSSVARSSSTSRTASS
jgi:hypothetical protein